MTRLVHTHRAVQINKANIAVIVLVIAAVALQPLMSRVTESRVYRDFTFQTPFRDVIVSKVDADSTTLTVFGTFKKVRGCQALGVPVIHAIKDGQITFGTFQTLEPESVPDSRPPSDGVYDFGPWQITSSVKNPDRAVMFRIHRCSDGIQTNVVFDIPWKDLP